MRSRNPGFKIRNWLLAFCVLHFAMFAGCGVSVPNPETPACAEAKEAVKRLYSFHFANDTAFTQENLRLREKFLTPRFYKQAQAEPTSPDPFTLSENSPRTFRVGSCEAESPDKMRVEVLLLWKTEEQSSQRRIFAEVVQQNGQWLIDNIFEKTII